MNLMFTKTRISVSEWEKNEESGRFDTTFRLTISWMWSESYESEKILAKLIYKNSKINVKTWCLKILYYINIQTDFFVWANSYIDPGQTAVSS